jgi:hypothetical protein
VNLIHLYVDMITQVLLADGWHPLTWSGRGVAQKGRAVPNGAERQRLLAKGTGKTGLKVDDVGPLRGHLDPC